MIPALLFWLFKKYAKPAFNGFTQRFVSNRSQKRATLSTLLLFHIFLAQAQEKTYTYQIKRNGNQIGAMQFHQKNAGNDTYLKMSSNVKTRFVFEINVQTNDEAHFKNGRLVYSIVNRKVNGKEKEHKETRLPNRNIDYNMMLLYCKEPVHITQVYSDSFQQTVPIKRTAPNTYRINLPNGNYNDYYFKNGICKLVTVYHSLYTITMELV